MLRLVVACRDMLHNLVVDVCRSLLEMTGSVSSAALGGVRNNSMQTSTLPSEKF